MLKIISLKAQCIHTIGHSNRSFEEFSALLEEHDIKLVADIRRFSSSRKFPHFTQRNLRDLLEALGVKYAWFESLGGYRHHEKNASSPNNGLKSKGFRNYADYMMTAEFNKALQELLSLAERHSTAVMCSEKFFWRCHRRLLSDALTARGVRVEHIVEPGNVRVHQLTQGAAITKEAIVIYPKLQADP